MAFTTVINAKFSFGNSGILYKLIVGFYGVNDCFTVFLSLYDSTNHFLFELSNYPFTSAHISKKSLEYMFTPVRLKYYFPLIYCTYIRKF